MAHRIRSTLLDKDLVDAKREFGWTTAAVTPEVGWEIELQRKTEFRVAGRAIEMLLNSLRLYQRQLGTGLRSKEDLEVMDKMERLVSSWRDEQTRLLGNSFGSVFRARYQPSLFAHSLRRYCDLYMRWDRIEYTFIIGQSILVKSNFFFSVCSNVGSLRHYSPQHRFYPESPKLLSHEIRGSNPGKNVLTRIFFFVHIIWSLLTLACGLLHHVLK